METRSIVFVLATLASVLEVDSATYCKVGEYFHPRKQFCSRCKVCGEGQAMIRACGTFHNAKCEECPNGTFARNGTCANCTICDKTKIETRPCNVSLDAICTMVKPDHSSWLIAGIGIAASVILLVVVVIVVAIVVLRRRRHSEKETADEEVPMASIDRDVKS